MNNISIIIPVLNEAKIIGKLLQYLLDNSSEKNIAEIIVVDGGSTDNTLGIVNNFKLSRAKLRPKKNLSTSPEKTILLLKSNKGRAIQMNLGAKNATGTILYFLHADSFPPKHFDNSIIQEVEKGNKAGCFKMKFDQNHWWLNLVGWLTKFSWRACRGGDQSQFITKMLFNDIGGFNEKFVVYEDNDLINKLYSRNQFVVIQDWLLTSARRYQTNGIWKLQFYFWSIYIQKWFGASAEELHSYYLKYID